MTDTDKLQVLYNYIKLIEPNNERIYLEDGRIFVNGFGASYMELYCKDGKFTAQSCDLNPNWLHKVFKVYRIPLGKVKDTIPSNASVVSCNRFYTLYPRNEGLFKDD